MIEVGQAGIANSHFTVERHFDGCGDGNDILLCLGFGFHDYHWCGECGPDYVCVCFKIHFEFFLAGRSSLLSG